MEIVRESDAALYIDAHREFGVLVGRRATDLLIPKAAEQGVSMAFIRDMRHWLRPSTIAEYLARRGLVGVVVNTGGPRMVAPPGGVETVIGTNPIDIGIPAGDEPVVADMATSKRAWGAVREARRAGESLQRKSFYDSDGNYAIDPDDAYSAVPMGDSKGFALGLLACRFHGNSFGVGVVHEERCYELG
jgi:LDH2 family malate/lactate/ureidoglycolate dehydrogenase